MSKLKFRRYPRSIVRKRPDYPSSLFVTVPAKIVSQMPLKAGDILEFVYVTEGPDSFIKVRRARED